MGQVHRKNGSTGLARLCHALILCNQNIRFRVLARGTENEFVDESVEEPLEFFGIMGPIDNVSVCSRIALCLGPQLAAKVLCRVHWRAGERLGNVGHVDNDSLDAVPLALNFRDQLFLSSL